MELMVGWLEGQLIQQFHGDVLLSVGSYSIECLILDEGKLSPFALMYASCGLSTRCNCTLRNQISNSSFSRIRTTLKASEKFGLKKKKAKKQPYVGNMC